MLEYPFALTKQPLLLSVLEGVSSVPRPLHAEGVRADCGCGNGVCMCGVYGGAVAGGNARHVGGVAMSDKVIGICADCGADATFEPEGHLLCPLCAMHIKYRPMWIRILNKLHDMELEINIEKMFEKP